MMHIFGKLNFLKPLKAFVLLIRPINLLIIALTAFLSWQALIGGVFEYFRMPLHMSMGTMILLILSLVLIAAGGYIINDYFDVDIDEINKPKRQIIGKSISRKLAVIFYAIFTLAGIAAGFWAALQVGNYQIGTVHVIFALALWFYSEQFKYIKFWGNFVVSLSTAFVIIVMWLYEFFAMVQQAEFLPPREKQLMNTMVLGYAAFAFVATFARELIKDRQDVPGDLRAGVRSLAVTMSDRGFKMLAAVVMAINFVMLVVAQIYFFDLELIFAAWFIFVLEFILLYLFWLLYKARSEADYGNMSLYFKVYILAGVLSMQVLYISW